MDDKNKFGISFNIEPTLNTIKSQFNTLILLMNDLQKHIENDVFPAEFASTNDLLTRIQLEAENMKINVDKEDN